MKRNYGEIMKFLLSVIAECLVMIMKECRVDGSYLLCPVDESKSLYKKKDKE